jgi:flagellum-specific ATP synthase
MPSDLSALAADLDRIVNHRRCGRVVSVGTAALEVAGLTHQARLGDAVTIDVDGGRLTGEVVALAERYARVMTYGPSEGAAVGNRVTLERRDGAHPGAHWLGRVVDAFGAPRDGRPLPQGDRERAAAPPPPPSPMRRKRLGPRLGTGISPCSTRCCRWPGPAHRPLRRLGRRQVLAARRPRPRGGGRLRRHRPDRRAGAGAAGVHRGVLGPEGLARSVVVVATSDEAPLVKRRAAWAAMAVAEHLRDEGRHVLLLVDSLTRFAEAHREVALTAGEPPSLRAYPPSTAAQLAALAERAGPGPERADGRRGDITAVFSVLVAGSDMEEPVADMTRGLLDGHVVLSRDIAERGRFPAVDVGRSVSRALPACASEPERAYQRPYELTCAHCREVMEETISGLRAKRFHASQQASTMAS